MTFGKRYIQHLYCLDESMSKEREREEGDNEQELTAKKLRAVVKDEDKPSLVVFLVLEALEWIAIGLVLLVIVSFSRPLWEPLWRFIMSFSGD